ncbi:MAG: tRNA uridine-5-carboxymethylaminomethyl(34) synthesis GTPase MnmE [Methylobacter sp.]|nr:MAG: tRNA uridine-5-carboxymethylaminomethyl(34) synthesis GTPase MnmE [Methylobacter sp.]
MPNAPLDTIAAIATPPGNGGVGIIRISGPGVQHIAGRLLSQALAPRTAVFTRFLDEAGSTLDSGIALYFPGPHSYTGEDVLELQAHGGAVLLNMLLRAALKQGARLANPGEFTLRAFLNNKLDLAQAEAVADLINAGTEQSARSAQQSLQGRFSTLVHELVDELIKLRTFVEAAIDFVDEEIDFLSTGNIKTSLEQLLTKLAQILATANQGRLLRDGMTVVLAGQPNVGKSSLLNALAGHDAAIVTDIAGTTRDVLKERVQLDGMPLHVIDTAGLRETDNAIEQEGIRRAQQEIKKADAILLLIDSSQNEAAALESFLPEGVKLTRIHNKIDLTDRPPGIIETGLQTEIYLSVKTGQGMELLKQHLKQCMGFASTAADVFTARTRHLEALGKALEFTENALANLNLNQAELVAEDLRQAQNSLSEITGEFTSDDLLGAIFSSFCIGK